MESVPSARFVDRAKHTAAKPAYQQCIDTSSSRSSLAVSGSAPSPSRETLSAALPAPRERLLAANAGSRLHPPDDCNAATAVNISHGSVSRKAGVP